MSGVGHWFWPKSMATPEGGEEDNADESILRNQLQPDVTSQDGSQDVLSTGSKEKKKKKKKRKSRELNADGGEEDDGHRKKKKKKQRMTEFESPDGFSGMEDVLAHLSNSIGQQPPKPKFEQLKDRNPISNGTRSPAATPIRSHLPDEGKSIDQDTERSLEKSKHASGHEVSATKAERPRVSFGTANKTALLQSILKNAPSNSSAPSRAEPPVTPLRRSKVPKSMEPPDRPVSSSYNSSPKVLRPVENLKQSKEIKPLLEMRIPMEVKTPEQIAPTAVPESKLAATQSSSAIASSPPRKFKEALTSATEKRRSDKWRTASMRVTLPGGYKPGSKDTDKPFHCPVTNCDKAFTRKDTLGRHMNIFHEGATYHDNKDGTLSIVGTNETDQARSDPEIPPAEVIKASDDQTPNRDSALLFPANDFATRLKNIAGTLSDTAEPLNTVVPNADAVIRPESTDSNPLDSAKLPAQPKRKAGRPKGSKIVDGKVVTRESSLLKPAAGLVTSSEDEVLSNRRSKSSSESAADISKLSKIRFSKPGALKAPSSTKHLSGHDDVHTYGENPIRLTDGRQPSIDGVMEPWEITPGHIRGSVTNGNKHAKTEEDIAFSSSFIASHEHGIMLPGLYFNILHLPGGKIHRWKPTDTPLQVCSVAVGKVNVTIGDKDFYIGPHGMWRIKAGETCKVANLNYGEAVVHISTVNGDRASC